MPSWAAYADLGEGSVAVRSSATAEDLPGAAFAGQQDTFLGVQGEAQVLDAVQRCWASLWTDRAIAYRARLGIDPATVAIAVVVQRLVPAGHAGVMFTANPVTGARDEVVIDSNPGLGEAVVAGLVTPDHAVLDSAGRIVERREGRRETVIRAAVGGGTQEGSADDVPVLTEGDLRRLAEQGRRIADHFGRPQDVEWAITDGAISILQARPMTALPPAPVPLSRFQRLFGPIILELVPRRPYPLETTAWIGLNVGLHVRDMVAGITGAHVSMEDVLPTEDGVVQAYVPPRPRPTRRTPRRLAASLARTRRDHRGWSADPRNLRFLAGADALAATDVRAADWAELVAIPTAAADLTDLITELRVEYLPAAASVLVRLRLLLILLRRRDLFYDLVLDADTMTQQANAELAELAELVRERPALARAAADLDSAAALQLLETDPDAAPVAARFEAFLRRFGHRETTSVLLPRDPTWSDSPQTVMDLVCVLAAGRGARRPDPAAPAAALERLLTHPLLRGARVRRWVRDLADRASRVAGLREDTHFELTRTMPVVHRALIEIGRRLGAAGALDDPEDVWFLTWPEIEALPDPRVTPADGRLREAAARRRAAHAELAASPLIATTTLYPERSGDRADPDALVSGVGGGGGRAGGPVRVVRGPEEFATLRSGDVLVCSATNPSWTPLFSRVAAVVVDNGGLASHAAIVAREYGIPAVMGSGNGTDCAGHRHPAWSWTATGDWCWPRTAMTGHVADHRTRPRRRGAALEDAIVEAAIEELREVGYAAMTMDSVARRAGAGKVSIYRRWPSRVELAMEAAYRLFGEPPLPEEPSSLREDLLAVLRFMARQTCGPAGEALRGIVSESLRDDTAARVAQVSRGDSVRIVYEIVRRAVERGEPVDPEPALLRAQTPGALLRHQVLIHGPSVDDAFVVALVDDVALPLLRRCRGQPP